MPLRIITVEQFGKGIPIRVDHSLLIKVVKSSILNTLHVAESTNKHMLYPSAENEEVRIIMLELECCDDQGPGGHALALWGTLPLQSTNN